jgi:YfiR/HmsC-like
LLSAMFAAGTAQAQDSAPTEYQIKAAFLFNFAKFIDWPAAAFDGPTSPMVFGILGDNPFHEDLTRTLQNKSIADHPLVIREYRSAAQATNCHILFISPSEKKRLPEILKTLSGCSVLTVSETDHFTESGGMINFFIQGSKIRLQINNAAASKAGLKISSKLLSLAARAEG